MEDDQVRRTRASANLLDRPVETEGPAGVLEVVRRTCGLQAQSWSGAALAVRARSTRTARADVDAARETDRSVVRGWFQRGTLHLVAADDAGWLLALLGPVLERRGERRYRQLGLDEQTRRSAAGHLERELSRRGPLTRAEIRESLLRKGLIDGTEAQAVYHLLWHTGLTGRICYGPDRDGEETWVATADWLGPSLAQDLDQAPAELAGRYLAAYGPATPQDLAAWSGLPVTAAREAFAARDDLAEVAVRGRPAAALRSQQPRELPVAARLLGEFDTYLLGHADRTLILDDRYRRRINAGGGLLKPSVVTDGTVAGTWRFDRATGATDLDPFDELPDLAAEIADIRRFHALAGI